MFGLPFIDVAVVAGYSVLLLGIGVAAMLRVRNQEDFFLGGRRFGRVLQVCAVFSQATSPTTAVGAVTTTYRDGVGGLWGQLSLLWTTPFFWFTAPWYRRMRVVTLGDFFRERFQSRPMAMFYSAIASFYLVLLIGIGLKALSVTVLGITLKPESALTAAEHAEYAQALHFETLAQRVIENVSPADQAEVWKTLPRARREFSFLDETWFTWLVVGVLFVYVVAGGLKAAVWIDAVQSVLILLLSFLLVPFAIAKLNALHATSGWSGAGHVLHQELPGHFFALFGSGQSADFTWYFVAVLCLMSSLNVAVQANQLTANASARDEAAAAVGFTTGTLIKRYCTVAWGLAGLLCAALYGREIQNPDLVWGHATRDLLGGVGFGLVGLMIACLLAALQSTASTLMISAAGLFTKNLYEPIRPGRSETHYLQVGRITGALVLVVAALLSLAFDTMLGMLKFVWEFNAIVAAAFWCGLKWRGATRAGAWAAMLVALLMFIVLPLALPTLVPSLRTNEALLRRTRERVLPHDYRASPRDVAERARQIARWDGPGEPPCELHVDHPVRRAIVQRPRAIYWTQGFEITRDGSARGAGMFNVELFVLDRIFDLSANPFALNETIRYAYKLTLPFAVLILVSLFTPRDDSELVRRFFLRMRTKVRSDRAEDEQAVQAAYANPEETTAALLFRNSQLEFFKWERREATGFAAACAATLGVIGCMWLLTSFGR